jgi:hypothetical protein
MPHFRWTVIESFKFGKPHSGWETGNERAELGELILIQTVKSRYKVKRRLISLPLDDQNTLTS